MEMKSETSSVQVENGYFSATQHVLSAQTATTTVDDSSLVDEVCLADAASTLKKLRNIIELYLLLKAERLEEIENCTQAGIRQQRLRHRE
jgi:hypothetical protein